VAPNFETATRNPRLWQFGIAARRHDRRLGCDPRAYRALTPRQMKSQPRATLLPLMPTVTSIAH
jgi:hypothetical protein